MKAGYLALRVLNNCTRQLGRETETHKRIEVTQEVTASWSSTHEQYTSTNKFLSLEICSDFADLKRKLKVNMRNRTSKASKLPGPSPN